MQRKSIAGKALVTRAASVARRTLQDYGVLESPVSFRRASHYLLLLPSGLNTIVSPKTSVVMSSDERGLFYYLQWKDIYNIEKPYTIQIDLPAEYAHLPKTNLVFREGREKVVHDVRGKIDSLSLDVHGFQYICQPTQLAESDFSDPSKVDRNYLSECEKILRSSLEGVDQVHFYHWQVGPKPLVQTQVDILKLRDSDFKPAENKAVDLNSPYGLIAPSQNVHVGMQTDHQTMSTYLPTDRPNITIGCGENTYGITCRRRSFAQRQGSTD